MLPSDSPFDISDRVALVTGAGRGLGRAIALGLAGAGANVAAAARSQNQVESVAQEVRRLGRSASSHVVDVRTPAEIVRMVDDVVSVHGRIDILVNAAGVKDVEPILNVTEEAWDLVIDTNLKGAFFCSREVGRHMLQRGSGKIVNVASTYAVVGAAERSVYAASKAGLYQLTKVMAIEWASHGVQVNAIGPTSSDTRMNSELFADPQWRRDALARIPAGRFLVPEDVVGSVIFLASDAATMVNGHLLLIDGGFTAQ